MHYIIVLLQLYGNNAHSSFKILLSNRLPVASLLQDYDLKGPRRLQAYRVSGYMFWAKAGCRLKSAGHAFRTSRSNCRTWAIQHSTPVPNHRQWRLSLAHFGLTPHTIIYRCFHRVPCRCLRRYIGWCLVRCWLQSLLVLGISRPVSRTGSALDESHFQNSPTPIRHARHQTHSKKLAYSSGHNTVHSKQN